MTTWHPSISKRWFVAAIADKIGHKPLAVTVLGRPLVLMRLDSGIVAMEDRCPHRQVPLSAGRVTPTGIECAYHGWVFGADGRCKAVPGLAQGDCLPKVGARTIAVRELDGMVWVRLAAEGDAAPPEMVAKFLPDSRKFLNQLHWRGYIVDVIENFLDPLHTHTVHPGLVRKPDAPRSAVRVKLDITGEGFVVNYRDQAAQSGILFRLFESPRVSEKLHFAGAGSAQIEYVYANGSVIRITLHFTPETQDHTHVFTTMHVENRWAPRWAVRWLVYPFLHKVARQDERTLELQAMNQARFPGKRGVSTRLDIVRANLEKIWEQGEPLTDADAVPESVIYL
ncbi:Rieske 2Fe-2S domain-containing protein [Pseudoduganella violaceinigra]|uniref:Rieske 2Fe-2S domain-containing protein n=1 Tax=Pseudoduganella violaceinigra TaxID=246602 RepID=UPI00040F99D4|nr:Rieske 2Fe-2S domain-containing protein [Pseudoduganella violaceinigra]